MKNVALHDGFFASIGNEVGKKTGRRRADARKANMIEQLRRHSVRAASIAHFISGEEISYSCGLLHDIGALLLVAYMHPDYERILARAVKEQRPTSEVEREVLGLNHQDLGAYLLSLWGLPIALGWAVAHHHDPAASGATGLEPAVVIHIADGLAWQGENSPVMYPGASALDEAFLDQIGVMDQLPAWREYAEHAKVPF